MGSFIIQNVRIFDGKSIIADTSVRVEDGIITEVGPDVSATELPTLSKPGHTLLPGLIDAHTHPLGDSHMPEQAFRFGITTILDLHNEHENAVRQKQWARERKDYPDVKSAHASATIENGWPAWLERNYNKSQFSKPFTNVDAYPNVKNVEDAEPYVEKAVADGVDFIKILHESGRTLGIPPDQIRKPKRAVQAAIVKSAHRRGLKVVAHATSLEDTVEILGIGVDGLAHAFFDKAITQEVIDLYKRHRPWVNPTLVHAGSLTGELTQTMDWFSKDSRVMARVAAVNVPLMHNCFDIKSPDSTASWEYAIDSVSRLKDAGIDIVCGTDSAVGAPGLISGAILHLELYLLVHRAGLTPLEALRSTTSVNARCFGLTDRGRIAKGLKADLILVEGDPSRDVSDLLNIRGIWRDGVRFNGHAGFPCT